MSGRGDGGELGGEGDEKGGGSSAAREAVMVVEMAV